MTTENQSILVTHQQKNFKEYNFEKPRDFVYRVKFSKFYLYLIMIFRTNLFSFIIIITIIIKFIYFKKVKSE